MDQLQEQTRQLLREHGFVMLEFSQVQRNGSTQLRVVGDRESGRISIEDCAMLTRELRNLIIEQKLLGEDFRLEVSSPGLDYPLRETWQYRKNVGRLLKIRIPGAKGPKELRGRLIDYDETAGLTLQVDAQVHRVERADVLSAVVLPEFK
ncbi:MAG: hypothetical protein H6506_01005 [Calditrichaeota bacterium]|nr:hypothetical protein [Calditrichota bacterium]MCB9366530.1 hypothetical protein [Calditrichota bacterium]MCB9391212.1 hypothetical protein [Calditrichota bacterium]